MAAVPVTCVRLTTSMQTKQIVEKFSTPKFVVMGRATTAFPSLRTSRFQISCSAKEDIEKTTAKIADKTNTIAADLLEKKGAAGTQISEQFNETKDSITSTTSDVIDKVGEKTKTIAADLTDKNDAAAKKAGDQFAETKDAITTATSDAVDNLVEKSNTLGADLNEKKDAAATFISEKFEEAKKSLDK